MIGVDSDVFPVVSIHWHSTSTTDLHLYLLAHLFGHPVHQFDPDPLAHVGENPLQPHGQLSPGELLLHPLFPLG